MKKPRLITGQIKLVRRGGFVPLPDDPKNEVYVPPEDAWPALSGNTVRVELTSRKTPDGKPIGRVVKVLERQGTEFVGTIARENGQLILDPDNERWPNFRLAGGLKPQENFKAVGRFLDWEKKNLPPRAALVRFLGPAGEHETEIQSIIAGHGIIYDFPPAAEAEAAAIKRRFGADLADEAKARRDLRGITTFTIDPADAKDFDDALSFRELGNGTYEVGVHIADVSHYVRPGTALDGEARRRATSIYLVDRTIPMLPEILSNDVCSLVPHQDRLTFSAIFTLTEVGELVNEWFGRTIIHSNHRFSYEEAQAVLDGRAQDHAAALKKLNRLAYRLREQKIEAGAITFDDTEIKFVLDEKGRPVQVLKKIRTDSHLLIEDFMLLANKRVAEFASRYNEHQPHTFVYRVHDWPNIEKLGALAVFLKPLGYDLALTKDRVHSSDLNQLLLAAAERAEGHIVHRAAIRAMAKAVYSTDNIGHWGLAFPYYTHFTSPIRRWPDVLVHRLLQIFLNGQKPSAEMLKSVSEDVVTSSAREAEAAEAERASVKYKQVEYMGTRIGEVFDGIISGVADFGLFVEELSTKAEGLVSVRDLNDYYDYDEKTISLTGRKHKKRYRLGDKVKIKVKAADPARRRLDFALLE